MSEGEFKARVGTMLRGKWSLDRLIGIGGMAAVYAATHKIGRTDAIKLLDPEVAVSDEVRARFEQEARAVNSIGHKGAVEIRDIDVTADGTPFLVMELLEGETLGERAANGRCTDYDQFLRLIDELLDVLIAAHAKGIIHRDIKPENLFVQLDGSLKVLDFGIARMRDGVVKTMAGTMLGTVAYMPPEQIKGQPVDRRADLFSVGATMFRVLADRPVHLADDEWQVGTKMLTEPAPALRSVAPHVPERIGWMVDRALAFRRERRYPNAATMRADVRAVLNGDDPAYALSRLEAGDDPHSLVSGEDGAPGAEQAPPKAETAPKPAAAKAAKRGKSTRPMKLGIAQTKRGMPVPERPPAEDDPEPAQRARAAAPTKAATPRSKPPRGGGQLAPTNPQMPAFAAGRQGGGQGAGPKREGAPGGKPRRPVAATDPQLPAFVAGSGAEPVGAGEPAGAAEVAPTDPQTPAFADGPAEQAGGEATPPGEPQQAAGAADEPEAGRSAPPPPVEPSAAVEESSPPAPPSDPPAPASHPPDASPEPGPAADEEPPASAAPDDEPPPPSTPTDESPPAAPSLRPGEEPAESPKRSRKGLFLFILCVLVAVAALAWWRHGRQIQRPTPPEPEPAPAGTPEPSSPAATAESSAPQAEMDASAATATATAAPPPPRPAATTRRPASAPRQPVDSDLYEP